MNPRIKSVFCADEYGGQFLNPLEEKLFNEMNRKLEFQILNAEIKAALPGLEKAAIHAEINIHAGEKAVTSKGTIDIRKIPSLFYKSTQELELEIDDGMKAKMRLKDILNGDVENLRKEKRTLTNEIGEECSFQKSSCYFLFFYLCEASFFFFYNSLIV